MGSLRFSDYCDASTILLPPSPIHSFHPPSYSLALYPNQSSLAKSSTPNNFSQWTPATSSTPVTTNPSRKRNRDESADETSETLYLAEVEEPNKLLVPEINKSTGAPPLHAVKMLPVDAQVSYPLTGESQTGIWLDEDSEAGLRARTEGQATVGLGLSCAENGIEPSEPCRKAQRRDFSSHDSISGDRKDSNGSPKPVLEDPAIDQFTHFLGVGWSRVSDDKDVQAAARGCAKYIENHYPLSMAKILLKSKSLDASLAETGEGYYLFQEDLSEGQLVGLDWVTCLRNLQRSPIAFEGTATLKAVRTPVIIPSKTGQGAWVNESSMDTDHVASQTHFGDDEMLVD